MSISGLETVEFQVGVFDQIPQKLQLDELGKMLSEDYSQNEFQTMISTYLSEDIFALDQTMNSSGMMADYRSILLDERNKSWIPQIEEAMKSKPVFVAVGAGHLAGEYGVINLLKNAGYTVEPIKK
jgi:uncharacterized protein YbaP (TraB family)